MTTEEELLKRHRGISLSKEMKLAAAQEIGRREPFIRHHFETKHYTQAETDMIGFLGEFAVRVMLGLNWREGIRPDYTTIDSHDVLVGKHVIDVKTESIPEKYIEQVITRTIPDNEYYGRRLYHVGQKNLVSKYEILVMGAVLRQQNSKDVSVWFPIGWLYATEIRNYPSGKKGPIHHSGKQIWYPFAAYQVATTALRDIDSMLELVKLDA